MKGLKLGAIFALSAALFGCGESQTDTADYLGLGKSNLKVMSIESNGKTEGYNITWFHRSTDEGEQRSVSVSPGTVLPVIPQGYQFTQGDIVRNTMVRQSTLPASFEDAASFSAITGGVYTEVEREQKYNSGEAQFSPCMIFKGNKSRDIYCSGVGEIESSFAASNTTATKNLIHFETLDNESDVDQLVATHIKAAAASLLPEPEHALYATWMDVCPGWVAFTKDPLSAIDTARACVCVYDRDKENAQTVAEYSDHPAPLGNGTNAQEFSHLAWQCASDAQASWLQLPAR